MQFHDLDTIVAIASAPAPGQRGIVRVSGPDTGLCVSACFSSDSWAWRRLSQPTRCPGHIQLAPPLGEVPADLYGWPTESSFTRQPSAELHTIGSAPILEACVAALCRAGARIAQPGEFTMRAFLAGRLDLTQAEAVLGVIDAESQRELDTALKQLAGGLATPLAELRELLLNQLAHLEAGLDFVEEDIEFISAGQLRTMLGQATQTLAGLQDQLQDRATATDAWRITLWGETNVGKSSLLNALSQQPSAIVSAVAGTTRDFVTRRVTWNGRAIELCDTAGVAAGVAKGPDELAQDSREQQRDESHLHLLCLDLSRALTAWERAELDREDARRMVVWTKADLTDQRVDLPGEQCVVTSSEAGTGLEQLKRAITTALDQSSLTRSLAVPGTALRCSEALRRAAEALLRAQELERSFSEELIAAEMRLALDELGQVVGAVYTEDVLDRIFSRFCIGK